jgi:hypothetical protein
VLWVLESRFKGSIYLSRFWCYILTVTKSSVTGVLVDRYLRINPIDKYGVYYLHRIRSIPA